MPSTVTRPRPCFLSDPSQPCQPGHDGLPRGDSQGSTSQVYRPRPHDGPAEGKHPKRPLSPSSTLAFLFWCRVALCFAASAALPSPLRTRLPGRCYACGTRTNVGSSCTTLAITLAEISHRHVVNLDRSLPTAPHLLLQLNRRTPYSRQPSPLPRSRLSTSRRSSKPSGSWETRETPTLTMPHPAKAPAVPRCPRRGAGRGSPRGTPAFHPFRAKPTALRRLGHMSTRSLRR